MTTQQEFHSAIKVNDFEKVKSLLNDKNVNPQELDNYSIGIASFCGHEKIVELLLKDKRVNPNIPNNWAIINANKEKHTNVVNILWEDPRVKITLQQNHKQLYNELTKKDVKNKTKLMKNQEILELIVKKDDFESFKLFIENKNNHLGFGGHNNILVLCCEFGNIKMIKILLGMKQVYASYLNNTAIVCAAKHGHINIVELLLKEYDCDASDKWNTSIISAYNNRNLNLVKLLMNEKKVERTLSKDDFDLYIEIKNFITRSKIVGF